MIIADCYFAIGKTHTVCEDYAISGTLERGDQDNRPFLTMAAVSDGCSSSKNSDWGSRFLCQSDLHVLANLDFTTNEEGEVVIEDLAARGIQIIERAESMRRTAEVSSLANDATLLMAYWPWGTPDIKVCAWGDGVIAARNRHSQEVEFYIIEFGAGAPGYLSYSANPGRKAMFMEATNEGEHTLSGYHLDSDQASAFLWEEKTGLDPVTLNFPVADYDLVAVLTDGAQSFQAVQNTGTGKKPVLVPLREVLDQIMNIKNHSKGFVTRRVRNGFLHRFCVKNEWSHVDDLGVGMVYIPDDSLEGA